MSIWSSIRRLWVRHDEHLVDREMERESAGTELPDSEDKLAIMNRLQQVEIVPPDEVEEP